MCSTRIVFFARNGSYLSNFDKKNPDKKGPTFGFFKVHILDSLAKFWSKTGYSVLFTKRRTLQNLLSSATAKIEEGL